MAHPSITFVIPVLNDRERLARCLASIAANNGDAVDVVVVDNGSTDGSAHVASQAGATLVSEPTASAVAALRNAGAGSADGEILAFVDADHTIGSQWVAAARLVFADAGTAAAGAVYTGEGRTAVQRAYDRLRSRSSAARQVAWLGSGNLAVRRSAFFHVGGFDERLQTCEDVDLCRRLRGAGWAVVDDPRLVSIHTGDPTTLPAVFLGELWRGRDNLVVSFRRPLDWRAVVSAVVPAGMLVAIVTAAVAAVAGAVRLSLLCAVVVAGVVLLRFLQLCTNRRDRGLQTILWGLPVAFLYETGRALALVARAGHGSRRGKERRRAAAE